MRHLMCYAISFLFAAYSFADCAPTPNSSVQFSQGDVAQIASLLGNATGSTNASQVGNGLALVQGISQLNTNLKCAEKNPTIITDEAKKRNAEITKLTAQMKAIRALARSAKVPRTATAMDSILTNFDKYIVSKDSCVSGAETAESTCVESKSPGAIKVKAMMEMATPALALISSAQKSCSTTSKLADFASKGLTVAKGVCFGAKNLCSSSCTTAQAQLTSLQAQIESFKAAALEEVAVASARATETMDVVAQAACSDLEATIPAFSENSKVALQTENSPTPAGTAGWLVAKCESHTKDLIMFGLTIASLVTAKDSADSCAEKLASGDSKTTTAQYCETAANANTQYCICQKNSTQQGCPGYVATTTTTPNSDEAGVDVKNTGKGNQFASANGAVKPTNALESINGTAGAAAKTTTDEKAAAATTAGGLSVGGGSGSAGDTSVGPNAALGEAGGKDAKAGSDKKWSFGSFMGMGGSGGSRGSSGNGSSNKLGQKNMDAIKRQIASEQLRAEVSEASGKSNWEKVRERYLRNSSTLINGK